MEKSSSAFVMTELFGDGISTSLMQTPASKFTDPCDVIAKLG